MAPTGIYERLKSYYAGEKGQLNLHFILMNYETILSSRRLHLLPLAHSLTTIVIIEPEVPAINTSFAITLLVINEDSPTNTAQVELLTGNRFSIPWSTSSLSTYPLQLALQLHFPEMRRLLSAAVYNLSPSPASSAQ